jgi:hypothetical protein
MDVTKRLVVGECYTTQKAFFLSNENGGVDLEKGSGPYLITELYYDRKAGYSKHVNKRSWFVVSLVSPDGKLLSGRAMVQYLTTHRNFLHVPKK